MKSRGGSCSLCVRVSFLSFGEKKKKFFLVAVEKLKKKRRERFLRRSENGVVANKGCDSYKKTLSRAKKYQKDERFFSRLESENKSLLRRSAARWCDDEKKKKKKKKTR